MDLLEKLKEKLKEVKIIYPWYEQFYINQHIKDFNDLPYMTTDILEKHYYHQEYDDSIHMYQTSGTSSNIRKKIAYSEADEQRYVSFKMEVYKQFLNNSACKKAFSDVGTGHAASTADVIFKKLQMESKSISFERPIEEHIQQLKTFKPDVLYTMPSILDHLIYATENPAEFGIKKIILVGEIATEEWQQKIANIFQIQREDMMDTLGSIEIGTIAYYSHDIRRYVFLDHLYAEGIQSDEIGLDMEKLENKESILVLTSFVRSMFPAIRFVTYDVVRDLRTMVIDGVEKQTFQNIVKRVGPEFKHGEKISIYDIEEIVYQHLKEASVRVKLQNNALTIYIHSKLLNRSILTTIKKDIQEKIPEIGRMINNKILDEIQVLAVSNEELNTGKVKNKKIYYEK
ncbi:CoF synthetase [Chengkuizengella sp. SCS-71B]|uniref:CoF synthetase n=1 Tax=Chengkuizengella sp. SCS-71B TaxID=3115290 RepID=UPI0032C23809